MVFPSAQVLAYSDMVRYHRAEQLDEFMDVKNYRYIVNIFYLV